MKSKVIAGVATVGLIAGVGAAAASEDIGGKLQSWYDSQFGNTKVSMEREVGNYVTSKIPSLSNEYNTGKSTATSQITNQGNTSATNASANINSEKDKYIEALEGKQAAIEAGLEKQFDDLFNEAEGLINSAGDKVFDFAKTDLGNATTNAGKKALADVETKINASKDSAVKELQAAIAAAKTELEGQLADEKDATTQEIKDAIDNKINALRSQLVPIVRDFINTQKGLITTKASELEANAMNELKDAVNNGF